MLQVQFAPSVVYVQMHYGVQQHLLAVLRFSARNGTQHVALLVYLGQKLLTRVLKHEVAFGKLPPGTFFLYVIYNGVVIRHISNASKA